MNISSIVNKLQNKESFYSREGAVTENDVKDIEDSLALKLPKLYREFVLKYGYIEWFGHVVCGTAEDIEASAIYYTKKARSMECPRGFMPFPNDAIVVEPYSAGGFYGIFAMGSPREGCVALFADEAMGQEVQFWKGFDEYLSYKLSVS